tara:strand:- start:6440 stop:7096 length:657 start_codon:yes stop_codon:yes gene_type:complete
MTSAKSKNNKVKNNKVKNNKVKNNTLKNKIFKKYKFTNDDYISGDGMMTSIWGPSLWHYLHTMSFNYPNNPTNLHKQKYKQFIENLKYTLPCKYCRMNLEKNLTSIPLKDCYFKNRKMFSYYVYKLHEHINKMLGKKSGLSYDKVRDRYENFRSRCTESEFKSKIFKIKKTKKEKKEKGCIEPLYGKKAKCIIKIVPQEDKCKTLIIDKKCLKYTRKK